ncbi:cell cycle regulator of non-homologous end joining [Podarcis raffonei]|uniref:cell cycle regulator of non-homologous end joining n=1 Tax=Podarcis raffonei TaxID=65483 RepID=UPI0023293C91|nr:cell cycle regulator of non-homologous end joining [Podarcis raffonei]
MGSPEAAKRILPTWMTKRVTEPAQQAGMKPKRRKKAALAKFETIYCMNEAELVDAALCMMAENCKAKEAEMTSSEDESQGPQQVLENPLCSSLSGSHQGRRTPSVGPKPPKELEALGCIEKTKSEEEEEEDALKYVREIFFT